MVRNVVTNINELRKNNHEIELEEDLKNILIELEESFVGLKGYGLAAPQIGYHYKVAIIRMDGCKLDLINPTIIEKNNKIIHTQEGCLSLPGVRVDTDRYLDIGIENGFFDKREMYSLHGLEAIVIQHEIDHLNGLIIFDRKHKKR